MASCDLSLACKKEVVISLYVQNEIDKLLKNCSRKICIHSVSGKSAGSTSLSIIKT